MIRDRVVGLLGAVPDRTAGVVLAVLAYVPMLATSPGRVSADTKTYLTVDPDGLMANAASMWDPSVGAGTVPHQNIGYVFPLGPYYWVMDRIGSPDWIAQRLLWATIVFAAAYGTYRLLRWLGWTAAAALVAAAAYGFSPYLLSYLARLSVILGPWAALPWMLLFAARAARTPSWRPAAWFALTVALVGSVNATSLVLVGLAPIIWLAADAASGRVAVAAMLKAVARIGVLCAGVSAWWIVGLSVQGTYGLPILRYTESYQAVASSSTPPEILRGLGYWFFYGGDRLDPWVGPSQPYIDNPVVVALGFLIAGLSLAGLLTAFVGRATAAVILLVGLIVSVGAAPLGRATPYGSAFEWLATETTVGAALRSTPRAAPLVVFALALGLGALTDVVRRAALARTPATARWSLAVPAAAIGLVGLQLFPWFTGTVLSDSLLRDEQLPAYETELAAWLDDTGDGRVYALPGVDFAAYRWGGTVDPVLPGLVDRSVLYRELVPQGGAGTADLLNALERRLADGWFEPETLQPIAGLLGVETIVVRNDLEHERYRSARPGPVYEDVTSTLGQPDFSGPLTTDATAIPLVDELTLARRTTPASFPAVAAFDLADAPLVDARAAGAPVVLAGSGDGLVDLAGAGLLDPTRPVLYAATLDDLVGGGSDASQLLGSDPWWVVTDTNRKQARRWSTIGSNLGALEAVDELQLDEDSGNNPLDVFDDSLAEQTIAVHRGDVAAVRASSYGNSFAYTPEDAPWFAIDGDQSTAWRGAVFDDPRGQVWEVDLVRPARPDTVTILQPITGSVARHIVDIEITLDDDTSVRATLDDTSRTAPGQAIPLPDIEFSTLRIEVLSDNRGPLSSYVGQPGVGLAEVVIGDRHDDRVVRLPAPVGDELASAGIGPQPNQRLTYVMTRERIAGATPNRDDPEQRLTREFTMSDEREFAVVGEVRLSSAASEEVLAALLDSGARVVADRRLPGAVVARGAAAFDGDPTTAWQTSFGEQVGARLVIDHAEPARAETVTVSWLADGRHSVPRELTLDNGNEVWQVPLADAASTDGVGTATAAVPGYSAATTTVTITAVDVVTSPNYFSSVDEVLPVGIVDIELGDTARTTTTPELATECRTDLLTIDGAPVGVTITGPDPGAGGELALRLCDDAVRLTAGTHRLTATKGAETGFDIDRIVLDWADAPPPTTPPVVAGGATAVVVGEIGNATVDASLAPNDAAVWVTMRQSWNEGWTLSVDGVDAGPPVLIDGYANGWILEPSADARTLEFRWTPQRAVRIGLILSALFGLLVVTLLVATRKHPVTPFVDARSAAGRGVADRRAVVIGALALVLLVGAGPLPAAVALGALAIRARWKWVGFAILVGLGSVVAAGVIALEWRRNYSIGPDWPTHFSWAGPLTWAVVGTIVALALIPGPTTGAVDPVPATRNHT